MKFKHKNLKIKNFEIEKPYAGRLLDAARRGQITEKEAIFYTKVYRKTIENPSYMPFIYLYRPKYRFGIKRWNGFQS